MKTLHLTNAWHRGSGGIGTFYRALIDAANETGHSIRLVAPGETTGVEDLGPHARIYTIRAPRAPFNGSYRMLYPYRFLAPGTAIQRILNDERPDLIEVSEKYTLPYLTGLLRVRGLRGVDFRPTVVGLSCERMDDNMAVYLSRSPGVAAFAHWYMKWIYFPMFDHHIAVSDHSADELRRAAKGHKVRRGVWVRPMGADTERFTPARRSLRERARLMRLIGGNERTVAMLYAGRLAPEKNLPLLVETLALLRSGGSRDFRLLIAGDGILMESLRKMCASRVPRAVTFLGHIGDRDTLADLFANCDMFAHPNPREPFGIAPLEAMAAGLPLLGPDSGGVTSFAGCDNAWLAKPDAESYAAAAREIAGDAEARERKVTAALATASRHRWKDAAEEYLKLYKELHARVQGMPRAEETQPNFYSTPGNAFGRETAFP